MHNEVLRLQPSSWSSRCQHGMGKRRCNYSTATMVLNFGVSALSLALAYGYSAITVASYGPAVWAPGSLSGDLQASLQNSGNITGQFTVAVSSCTSGASVATSSITLTVRVSATGLFQFPVGEAHWSLPSLLDPHQARSAQQMLLARSRGAQRGNCDLQPCCEWLQPANAARDLNHFRSDPCFATATAGSAPTTALHHLPLFERQHQLLRGTSF